MNYVNNILETLIVDNPGFIGGEAASPENYLTIPGRDIRTSYTHEAMIAFIGTIADGTVARTELDIADNYNDVWVLGEIVEGEVHKVTLELLGIARELADKRASKNCKVVCLLMGSNLSGLERDLFYQSADKVIIVNDESLKYFNDSIYASVVSRLINKYKPEILISGATSKGRSLMPLVAVQVETGLTADCTGLDIDEESGLLLQTRPAYGGNIIATIKCENHRRIELLRKLS